jgi:acyl-CoA synthetase (AMP-forming)/AMP-acid ligase II
MQLEATDRCISWLPWYHDMGLVGCFLSLIANQISVDYLKTEDFARRPLAWLDMISRNPGTRRSAIRRPSAMTSARAAFPARAMSPNGSTCRAGGSRATAPT